MPVAKPKPKAKPAPKPGRCPDCGCLVHNVGAGKARCKTCGWNGTV
jgi:hypothetical protein